MTEKLLFHSFNEHRPVRMYRHAFLPHLRQKGCTYFVTFRLADSIPQAILREWKAERYNWLKARGLDIESADFSERFRCLPNNDKHSFERTYAKRLFEELDKGHGDNFLNDSKVAKEVANALRFFHGTRLELGDFVVMSNHVHALIRPLDDLELEDILHSVKSYSANKINKLLSRNGALWMAESYDRLVRDPEELLRTQAYIRANPAKAGLSDGQFNLGIAEYQLCSEAMN